MINEDELFDDIIKELAVDASFNMQQVCILRRFAIKLDDYIDAKIENFKEMNNIGDI
jgi:hypothetical protein